MSAPIARALWYEGAGHAAIREEALPAAPPEGAVRVVALYSGLSRGTESLIFHGRVPPSEYGRMRGPNMGGAFPFPVKYGYCLVGRVEAAGHTLDGRTVFALHPHQTIADITPNWLCPLPDGVPAARGVLTANMETALNAVWDAGIGPGDRVAVVGAGVVGAMVAYLSGRIAGTEVTLVDIDPRKAGLAAALKVAFAGPDAAPRDCDVVVHASASAAGLSTALDLAGFEATVLELSWYGLQTVAVPLGGAFHARRLKLVSSQVGSVADSRRARWTHFRRMQMAATLLADPVLDTLLAPPIAFGVLPDRLDAVFGTDAGVLCQLVDYASGKA